MIITSHVERTPYPKAEAATGCNGNEYEPEPDEYENDFIVKVNWQGTLNSVSLSVS